MYTGVQIKIRTQKNVGKEAFLKEGGLYLTKRRGTKLS